MSLKQFKLIKKNQIANNIFKLSFETNEKIDMKPGQFITFILPKIGGRAYSVLEIKGNIISFIIKRWAKDNGGRGGSLYICDLKIGESLNGVGPAGHFILRENNKNKLFLATGTGFPPLYNQALGAIEKKLDCNLKIIFGARTKNDLFYEDELKNLKENNSNFLYEIYLSREELKGTKKGYITDFLTLENTKLFEEFYICGASNVIDSTVIKLKENGVNEENIFTEKY